MENLPNISLITIIHDIKSFYILFKYHWETLNYPKDKLEWIIIDTSKEDEQVKDLLPPEDMWKDFNITYEYEFQCCDKIICSKCIFEHIKTTIDDIQFKAIKCPFCNIIMQYNKVYQICRKNKNTKYSNKYKEGFQQLIKYKSARDIQKLDEDKNNKIKHHINSLKHTLITEFTLHKLYS